ncbi:glycoside hydrolase family 18 protein [Gymnopus androsaceus JB14]|uniref:Glycoside hydrolase family 18 protein n=1 Tax=Gymnopus androsaceus JB14 TaxID=1447944 RepID=A0A6A4HAQ1_9AGAR|nr:glycoside hydrolase family 18 protein [Gymnopus androsaceus JB14]
MFISTLAAFSSLILYCVGYVNGTPIDGARFEGLSDQARDILSRAEPRDIVPRAEPIAPFFVVYSDRFVQGLTGPPPVADVTGFTVFAMSFLLLEGPFDKAEEWVELTAAERASIKAEYAAAGISLVVSVFGSVDVPTSTGADPIATANTMAAWVIEFGLDGIDVDYEDFNAFDAGTAEAWLISFTTQLRTQLPQGTFILTHAPVAPWFSPNLWPGGGYIEVHEQVGDLIDWYNIQFYNQGTTEYTTCAGLLTESSTTWPESALFQIAASGVTLDKLVIGKPAVAADETAGGFIDPGTLATCVEEAKGRRMDCWKYPDAAAAWIAEVRADSWPV